MTFRSFFWIAAVTILIITACAGDDDPTPTQEASTPEAPATQPSPTPAPASPTVVPEEPTPTVEATNEPTSEPAATGEAVPTATAETEPTPVPAADLDALNVQLQEVTSGLNTPVKVVSAYDGTNRLFIVEKDGTIAVVQDGTVEEQRFLAISERVGSEGSEQGLLGLAFHPDFAANGFLYVNYTDTNGNTVVSRFSANEDRTAADPDSEFILLQLEQPAANHNGGHLLFGPDGYLYIGTGDGGGSGDTFDQAQNPATLLGKMLRIDVDSGDPYGIPADNPFLDDPDTRDEIWATGLRNPWRYDFDRATGDLYIADVGQNRIEEVSFQPADSTGGENYGWPIMEGTDCFEADSCEQEGLVLPVTEYTHDFGCSVTGGNVYRGEAFPEMAGIYFFSDFCTGNVWGLANVDGQWQTRLLLEPDYNISSFGEDEAGEIYLVDMYSGVLYRLEPAQ